MGFEQLSRVLMKPRTTPTSRPEKHWKSGKGWKRRDHSDSEMRRGKD